MVVHWTRIYLCLVIITMLFLVVGCGSFYKMIGIPESEVSKLVEDDSVRTLRIVQEGRTVFWQAATAILGSLGTAVSVLLGKYLNTERKLTKAVILGVEDAGSDSAKATIANKATKLGVSKLLAKRVNKIVG